MRLEQLRLLCAVAEEKFSVSRAAAAAHISQPNVSKQIKLLEEELNVDLLRRHKGRVIGLTEAGDAILALAHGVLRDIARIGEIPSELTKSGELRVATTHLHARYVLPEVVLRFRRIYQLMQINLVQADTPDIIDLVTTGRADIGLGSRTVDGVGALAQLPCFEIRRSLIAPRGHPLLKRRTLRLQEIASYPLVGYSSTFASALVVQRAFGRVGLRPSIAIAASDSEVVKTYVRLGLGIAVLPSIAYDQRVDRSLRARDVSEIFERTMVDILVRPESATRPHVRDFMALLMEQVRASHSTERGGVP